MSWVGRVPGGEADVQKLCCGAGRPGVKDTGSLPTTAGPNLELAGQRLCAWAGPA